MSGRKKGNPFVQLELDALNKMDPAARLAGVERWSLIGRLAELWAYGLRAQRETYDINEVQAFLVGKDEPADKVIAALATFNFLQIEGPTIRVRGIGRYFPNEGRQKAASETNQKKMAKNGGKNVHDRTGTVTVNARSAPQDDQRWGETDEDGASLAPDRDGQATVPRIYDLGSGLDSAAFSVLEPEESFSHSAAERAAVGVLEVEAAVSVPTRDHVARVDGFKTPQDFATRFTAAFRANTPPEPAAGPPLNEQPPPKASHATPPAAPAINEIRPSAETPEKPASPGHEEGVDDLEHQMEAIHQRVRGRSYPWKDIDRDILVELQLEGFTAQNITEWWEGALGDAGRRMRYLRELKLLMLKEARPEPPKPHPKRFNADDGIMRGGP